MRLNAAVTCGLLALPAVSAWGSLGHITTAYIASNFIANSTEAYLKELLRRTDDDYLASVASWADSIRYTKWGKFTSTFHFIDAHDQPPHSCNVDLERDCKQTGCVVSSLTNYTEQLYDDKLPAWRRAQAAKFVVHFVGDLHQPLHNEDVARGGNGILVRWGGRELNLHHVWDSSILEKWLGGLRGKPYPLAKRWATQLTEEISHGKWAEEKESWIKDINLADTNGTALAWSREANALVCSHVLPQGPETIKDQELSGQYYEDAAPILEKQVALAGYRMAALLDKIAEEYNAHRKQDSETQVEL
ncbi:Nuclease S1 [Beauveria bassiana]|uniref:Nuclease S1 n=1 Tax=Beauveria bassiana (strain ARSEF 2860) TaxID=655819 RepID=J4W1N8_BEAB2|nr:nuclease S1 [Beauveria bassiana ARSEF 2860]EJP64395.1 nuclease S1 [Beauveria bassiana ARSEF 2860]KAH8711185.1 Nuclease S1 [Beauveria bassiana]